MNKNNDEGYFTEFDIQYPENLHNLYNDLPFLSGRMKIEKNETLVVNLHGKEEYVIHIKNLKQASNHKLVLKNEHRAIKFNQKNWYYGN